MPVQQWSTWSSPGADPYAWLDHWLDTYPGVGAALLAAGAEGELHGRLLFLRSHAAAGSQVRHLTPWKVVDAPVVSDALFRRLTLAAREDWTSPAFPHLAASWLPTGGDALRVIPLVQEGRVAYWLFLSGDHHVLNAVDLRELTLGAALGLGSAKLFEIERQQRRRNAADSGMAEVQRLLQPHQSDIAGLDYALHWQPAETAAGDYYDVMSLSNAFASLYDGAVGDVWGAVIGDVSGHGAAAAMEAVQFDAILRTYKPETDLGPGGAITYANKHYFSRQNRQRFMSVLAIRYRPDLNELCYANAGHVPLLVRRPDGVSTYGDGDIPIGVLRDQTYQNMSLPLASGDLLMMYTDGIVEARNQQGEQFGLDRLTEVFAEGPARPQAMLNAVLEALFRHQGGAIGVDDQTVVVLGITATG